MTKKVCITYFCYKGDQDILLYSIKASKILFPQDTHFFVADDADNPMDKEIISTLEQMGVSYNTTTFKRKGNLNGLEAIRGILSTMLTNAESCGADIAFKSDADTFLVRPEMLEFIEDNPDIEASFFVYRCRLSPDREKSPHGYGMLYSMGVNRLKYILDKFNCIDETQRPKTMPSHDPEDVWVSSMNYLNFPDTTALLDHYGGSRLKVDLPWKKNILRGFIGNWTGEVSEANVNYILKCYTVVHFGNAENGTKETMKEAMELTLKGMRERYNAC